MPDQLIIQAILFVASTAYQVSQQNKMKRKMEAEAEKRKGFKFNSVGTVEHLPVVYGKQLIGGVQTKTVVNNSFTAATQQGNIFKTTEVSWDSNRTGSKNEYLLVENALCIEGINSCEYVKINDKPFNHVEKDADNANKTVPYDNIISVKPDGGTANALSTANGVAATNKFTGAANATAIYRLNRDEPQYNGVPNTGFFIKGRKVRAVNLSGSTYSLSSTYAFSNNPALCLLDYLLGSFGRGLSVNDVDLPSFYSAANLCDTVVVSARTIGGRVNGVKPIKELANLGVFPAEGDPDVIYKAENTGIFYNWNGSAYATTTVPTRNIPLYECNIALDTEATVRDNIELIMGTMGLAELIWSSEGKYKLLLAYPTSSSALTALVNSAHVFVEDDILREPVSITYPSAKDRYNRVTVRFDNEHEDFKEDSMSWPPLNGTAHNAYLVEDNNQPMTTDLFLQGITDPYHALAKAEQMVRQSRSLHFLKFSVGKKGLSLEPGDFIKVTIPQSGITNEIYRVESLQISADLTVALTCYFFDHTALAWNVADNIAHSVPPTYDFSLPKPTNVVVTPTIFTAPDGTTYSSLAVNWTAVDSVSLSRYEVFWRKTSETSVPFETGNTKNTKFVIQNIEPNVNYTVKVRAVTALGISSAFQNVTSTNVGKDTNPNPPSGLTATGNFGSIKLNWTNPVDADFKHVEIWEGSTTTQANAVKIATSPSDTFIRGNLGPAVTKYFWIRSVDRTGNFSTYVGPANALTALIGAADIASTTIPYSALATSVTSVIDTINSNAATTNSNVTSLTSSLATTNGNVTTNASGLSGLVTTVSNLDGVVTSEAAKLTTLTSTVGTQTTNISNLTTTTNGIQARHGVEIDNNGIVTGYQLLSGAGGVSAFNIQADQFNVSAGGDFSNPVFAVRTSAQTIGGTVHPAGVYVTGYLSADKIIATTSIASPFANIGTVTSGVVQSADGRTKLDLTNNNLTVKDTNNVVRVKLGLL